MQQEFHEQRPSMLRAVGGRMMNILNASKFRDWQLRNQQRQQQGLMQGPQTFEEKQMLRDKFSMGGSESSRRHTLSLMGSEFTKSRAPQLQFTTQQHMPRIIGVNKPTRHKVKWL